jgi:hypothetical protein
MKNNKNTILTGCIIFFSIILLFTNSCYSQQSDIKLNYSTRNFQQDSTNKNKIGILLSVGAGTSMKETAFILSANIILELHKHINVSTGFNYFFRSARSSSSSSFNIIPYYVISPLDKTILQFGIGIANYQRTLLPVISAKFDFEISHNNYLGLELKSFVFIGVDQYPFPQIHINYSIRL